MISESAQLACKAINKFFYFSMNYPYNFIEEVWKDEPGLASHLRAKFDDLYERKGSYGVINAFYAELDGTNRMKLMLWVLDNRKDDLTGLNKSYFED